MDREFEQLAILDSIIHNFCRAYRANFVSQRGKAGAWKASFEPHWDSLGFSFTNQAFGFLSIYRYPSQEISWRWYGPPEWWISSRDLPGRRHRNSGPIPEDLFGPMTDALFKAMRNYLRNAGMSLPPLFNTVR